MTIPPNTLSAVVLAGGYSIRMGRDKAWLPHPQSGAPLLHRQLDLLAQLAPAHRLVSARTGQSLPSLPADVIRIDDDGTGGPLGGIVAGLTATAGSHLLVIAIDLPRLDLPPLLRLIADCDADHGAVAITPTGTEPLIAVYPRLILPLFTPALKQKQLSLRRLLDTPGIAAQFRFTRFEPAPSSFHNWNTPA